MKCTHCGGTIVPDPYDPKNPPRCHMCGREPKMTTKAEDPKVIDADRSKEKRCNKCKKSLSMDKFSFNRATPDGFDRTCKECWKTARANRKKKKKEKTIRAGTRGGNPVIDKTPKGNPSYTDTIELPAQLIRAISHSIAKRISVIIMEHFPE